MPIPTPPLKAGVTTTEFWTVIICGALLTAQAALSMTTLAWASGGTMVLGAIYVYQRGKLKSQESIKALELDRRERETPKP